MRTPWSSMKNDWLQLRSSTSGQETRKHSNFTVTATTGAARQIGQENFIDRLSYSLVEPTTPLAADRRSSRERFILCVLLLFGAIMWLPRLNGPLDLRWDAGTYYILGTSLAEGRGYRLLNEPGNIESIQYPPLLPSVIAIYQLALGTSDPHRVGQALRFTFAFVFIAFVLTSYLILKHYLPTAYALLGALIVLVNPTTIVISDFCLSDLPFALISASSFFFTKINIDEPFELWHR